MKCSTFINTFFVIYCVRNSQAELLDYFKSIGQFFGYSSNANSNTGTNLLTYNVPYEVSIDDENFIAEAAKLTSVSLSQLDSCQHRVIYKLQTSCHNMNDEDISKLAVMLLNCQSWVEGRKIYSCSETMSIRDCTKEMDPDAWNSYHLITNRARAVCYSVRQSQFRGLTELTVNKLMTAAKEQLDGLSKIAEQQNHLHQHTQDSLKSVSEGHEKLMNQQRDFYRAQLHGQLSLEDNIRRLTDEKHIISEAHKKLTELTKSVQSKLNEATKQIEQQVDESKDNHQELIGDLDAIQKKAEEIFQRIEQSVELLTTQNQLAQDQYKMTLLQLSEFNSTIHYLVTLVDTTKRTIDERLSWLITTLGGTDMAIEKLYAILWHALFLIVAMISCAFLSAYFSIRIAVATLPSLNLILALQKSKYALGPLGLMSLLTTFAIGQLTLIAAINLYMKISNKPKHTYMLTENGSVSSTTSPMTEKSTHNRKASPDLKNHEFKSSTSSLFNGSSSKYEYSRQEDKDIYNKDENDYNNLLPLRSSRSRSHTPLIPSTGLTRRICGAKTRKGTQCRITSTPGREYCSIHQNGDSVMIS